MATQRELQDILNSGQITGMKVGGTGPEKEVALQEDLAGERTHNDFTTTTESPEHKEGRLFYDKDSKALSYYNENADVTLNIGQEQIARIKNESGSTIFNGVPVRATGLTSVEGLPLMTRAQANLISNAYVAGVATHDISNGEIGYITTFGLVRDVDLSAFNIGDVLYLSDTVLGGLTADPPDITSRVGTVLDNAVAGIIFTNVENLKTLQTTLAWLDLLNGPSFTVDIAPTLITNYTQYDSVIMTGDPVTGLIKIPIEGVYRITVNFSCSFNSSNQARILTVHLWDEDTNSDVYDFNQSIVRDMATASGSFSIPARAQEQHDIGVRVSSIGSITGFAFDDLSFDIQSLHIR